MGDLTCLKQGSGVMSYVVWQMEGGTWWQSSLPGRIRVNWCQAGLLTWRRQWQPTPVFLPGGSHGWRSLVGYSPQATKESDTTERLHSFRNEADGKQNFGHS